RLVQRHQPVVFLGLTIGLPERDERFGVGRIPLQGGFVFANGGHARVPYYCEATGLRLRDGRRPRTGAHPSTGGKSKPSGGKTEDGGQTAESKSVCGLVPHTGEEAVPGAPPSSGRRHADAK